MKVGCRDLTAEKLVNKSLLEGIEAELCESSEGRIIAAMIATVDVALRGGQN